MTNENIGVCVSCGKEHSQKHPEQRHCSSECFIQEQISAEGKSGDIAELGQHMQFDDNEVDALDDEALWSLRAEYWNAESESVSLKVDRRERPPLILSGHGIRLNVHRGALVISNGLTHYPQKPEEQRIFPGDPNRPSRIVLIESDGSLTISVMKWLSEQSIPLFLITWRGEVVSAISGDGLIDVDLRRAQLEAEANGAGLELSKLLITNKINASIETIESLDLQIVQARRVDGLVKVLKELEGYIPDVERLRLIEAKGAHLYFGCWQPLPITWTGTNRRPIPESWRQIGSRTKYTGSNRHANHPINALLNYGYAVLESQVTISATANGLDPTIGYLHSCRKGRNALIYDLMEPLRPVVDRHILRLVRSRKFTPVDFTLNGKGVCRLHPDLSKHVAESLSINRDMMGGVGAISDLVSRALVAAA